MKILKKVIDALRLWFLQRAHKKLSRTKKLLGYHQAQNFGILYDATLEENYRHITQLVKDLQQQQKKVKTLGFIAQKKMPEHAFPKLTFEFCNAKNFSWTQQPLAPNVNDFIANEFDVLLDLTPSNFYQIKHLCAISGSTMKVGRFVDKYVEVYDLMLQLEDQESLAETSRQVLHYLKMINNDQSN